LSEKDDHAKVLSMAYEGGFEHHKLVQNEVGVFTVDGRNTSKDCTTIEDLVQHLSETTDALISCVLKFEDPDKMAQGRGIGEDIYGMRELPVDNGYLYHDDGGGGYSGQYASQMSGYSDPVELQARQDYGEPQTGPEYSLGAGESEYVVGGSDSSGGNANAGAYDIAKGEEAYQVVDIGRGESMKGKATYDMAGNNLQDPQGIRALKNVAYDDMPGDQDGYLSVAPEAADPVSVDYSQYSDGYLDINPDEHDQGDAPEGGRYNVVTQASETAYNYASYGDQMETAPSVGETQEYVPGADEYVPGADEYVPGADEYVPGADDGNAVLEDEQMSATGSRSRSSSSASKVSAM
jgi:hypothetical protein